MIFFLVEQFSEYYFSLPGITDYLYDSSFDSVMLQVFSNNKQFLGASGPFPQLVCF